MGFVPQQQPDFNKLLFSASCLYCSLTNAFFSSFVFIYIILNDPYLYGYNGYLSKVSNLSKPAEEWVAGGMPITKMMNIERRNGEDKPVIKKALVELDGKPFKFFEANRDTWAVETAYTYPGAIQYYGPTEVCDLTTRTLALEKGE